MNSLSIMHQQPNYDIEFVPMVRTSRGYGADLTYRFADSPYSTLKLNGGFFKESEDYAEENNLSHDKHLGWSINYNRMKLFSGENSKDGLLRGSKAYERYRLLYYKV